MDISPGDSTPTSEASYSHSSTPTIQQQNNNDGPVLLANALPRLVSHPSTPTNSQLHFTTPSSVNLNTTSSSALSCSTNQQQQQQQMQQQSSSNNVGNLQSQHQISKLIKNDNSIGGNCNNSSNIHTTCLPASSPSTPGILGGNMSNSTGQTENMLNSNTPGPPAVTLANLPKLLSQITGNKSIDQNELNPQKALQTINTALMMSSRQQIASGNDSNHNSTGANSLRYVLYSIFIFD